VQLIRERLERVLAPRVATSVIFDALDRWDGGIPGTAEEVLEMVRGPLGAILLERLGPDESDAVVADLESRLRGPALEPDEVFVEIDVEEELDDSRTALMTSVPHPVSVLVAGSAPAFGELLVASLGEARVHVHGADDEPSLRHATFSANPLIVVVDATTPPEIAPSALAAAIRGLPDATLAVVWGEETPYGRETRARVESLGAEALYLPRREGIGPLLDLVLSRHRRASTVPPPQL